MRSTNGNSTPVLRENGRVNEASSVPAVDRTLDILEFLSAHSLGAGLAELSVSLQLPKNAVFRITNVLRARGYVTRDETTKRYTLTRKFLTITQPKIERKSLVESALPFMRELRDETGETVQIGVRSGGEGVILEQVESSFPLRIAVDIGLRFKFYNNAPGKLILAHMPEKEREQQIKESDLAPCTPRTITDRDELRKECERIIAAGYSTDYGEADEGIHCISAPIFNGDGSFGAALWISGPARRLPYKLFAEKAEFVKKAAHKITAALSC